MLVICVPINHNVRAPIVPRPGLCTIWGGVSSSSSCLVFHFFFFATSPLITQTFLMLCRCVLHVLPELSSRSHTKHGAHRHSQTDDDAHRIQSEMYPIRCRQCVNTQPFCAYRYSKTLLSELFASPPKPRDTSWRIMYIKPRVACGTYMLR